MKYHNHGKRDKQKIQSKKIISQSIQEIVHDAYFYNVEDKDFYSPNKLNTLITLIKRNLSYEDIPTNKINECKKYIQTYCLSKDFFTNLMKEYANHQLNNSTNQLNRKYIKCYEMKNLIEILFSIQLDESEIGIYQEYQVKCVCGSIAIYDDTDYMKEKIYSVNNGLGINEFKKMKYITHKYICPNCHRECYTHRGTNIPFGDLADPYIRSLRALIHKEINHRCHSSYEIASLYKELSTYLQIETNDMHISQLNESQLKQVLYFLKNKK